MAVKIVLGAAVVIALLAVMQVNTVTGYDGIQSVSRTTATVSPFSSTPQ